MSKLKKYSISLAFAVCLLCVFLCGTALADETDNGTAYTEAPVYVDGLLSCRGYIIDGNSYVPLDAACAVLGYNADISFEQETNTMTAVIDGVTVTAQPGASWIVANGRYLMLPNGYMTIDGMFIIPTSALAKIFTLSVSWDAGSGAVNIDTAGEQILRSGDEFYNSEDLYWMSRIITAEAGNQPLAGQIGVGNVVMNRVADGRFPSTVKGVIFQSGQFSPVAAGSVYSDPFPICVVSAKLALEGYNTVGSAIYFQVGRYWGSDMVPTTWLMKIGDHNFFI